MFILNESIEDNIRFGNFKAKFSEAEDAARIAGCAIFIERLPLRYSTVVGERGYKLSGGERQSIALASAVLKNPHILILDEATSHLDSRSEYLIMGSLNEYFRDRTVIIVAHRLSTIICADQIFVFDQGKLVEGGTHRELVNSKKQYAHLWSLQSNIT